MSAVFDDLIGARQLVRDCIEQHVDQLQLAALIKEEEAAKETLNEMSKGLGA